MPTHETVTAGFIASGLTLLLPRIFTYLTRGRAMARADTLKEIADRTSIMERHMTRLEQDNLNLRKENERNIRHIRELDFYVDELENILRKHNISPPTPPWMTRLRKPPNHDR